MSARSTTSPFPKAPITLKTMGYLVATPNSLGMANTLLRTQPRNDILTSVREIIALLLDSISQYLITQILQAPMVNPSIEISEARIVRIFLGLQHANERETNANETICEIDGSHLQHPAGVESGPIRSCHRKATQHSRHLG